MRQKKSILYIAPYRNDKSKYSGADKRASLTYLEVQWSKHLNRKKEEKKPRFGLRLHSGTTMLIIRPPFELDRDMCWSSKKEIVPRY